MVACSRLVCVAALWLSAGACTSTAVGGSGGAGATSTSSSAGGSSASDGGGGAAIDYCSSCAAPVVAGTLASPLVGEASGLVASRVHPDAFYLHNDSGDMARFFATDSAGADLGAYALSGVVADDFEDIAAGPCPVGDCLYLADIGDNNLVRQSYVVHRLTEPAALAPGQATLGSEPLSFQYPDGSHNAETLLAHPLTGQLFVVTKVSAGPSALYAFPQPPDTSSMMTLTKLGELTPPEGAAELTGGDVHPAGTAVLLRSYTNLLFYPLADDIAAALAAPPCLLPTPDEPQGESVAWQPDGSGYLTVSEGLHSPIYLVHCVP